jgi:hypothetical protein
MWGGCDDDAHDDGGGHAGRHGPDPSGAYIQSVTYAGSGCPQGTIGLSISSDRTTVTMIFDAFIASTGSGRPLTESRKSCLMQLTLHLPQGWALTLGKADYRGYVQLDTGLTASRSTTYSFQGFQARFTQPSPFAGPVAQDYLQSDQGFLPSFVPTACNAVGTLDVNTLIQISGGDGHRTGQMTLDSFDGKLTKVAARPTRTC